MTRMGGIVGYSVFANATIRNCVNYGTIDGSISGKSDNIMLGGVVGFAQRGILENCVNLGAVSTGDARGGGLFGVANQADLVVRNCLREVSLPEEFIMQRRKRSAAVPFIQRTMRRMQTVSLP